VSDVKRRVGSLERELGQADGDLCSCPGACRIEYDADTWPYDDRDPPDPGPLVCPKCGRPRLTIEIAYTENWRGKGGEP